MGYYVGLDVSLKRTAICVLDGDGRVVWRGSLDTHPESSVRPLTVGAILWSELAWRLARRRLGWPEA